LARKNQGRFAAYRELAVGVGNMALELREAGTIPVLEK